MEDYNEYLVKGDYAKGDYVKGGYDSDPYVIGNEFYYNEKMFNIEDGEMNVNPNVFEVINVPVPFIKCNPNVKVPQYAHYNDSGMDLYSNVYVEIEPGETVVIGTGIKVAVPDGLELQIRATSGNSLYTNLRMANSVGTIDAGYRGEVGVIIDNVGPDTIIIEKYSKIAQAILAPVYKAKLTEVQELPCSQRQEKGYGQSTGGVFGEC